MDMNNALWRVNEVGLNPRLGLHLAQGASPGFWTPV